MQPLDLGLEPVGGVAVEPVGDEQHHGALGQHPARPVVVEGAQTRADAGAAVPVLDRSGDAGQGGVDVALAELAGDVGQPGAEDEAVHPVTIVGHCVHEMQEHARIAAHGARDVAKNDQRRWSPPAALEPERDDVAARAQAGAQAGAHIDAPAPRVDGEAPRRHARGWQAHAPDDLPGPAHFVGRHVVEVAPAQHLARRVGHGGVVLGCVVVAGIASVAAVGAQRVVETAARRPDVL